MTPKYCLLFTANIKSSSLLLLFENKLQRKEVILGIRDMFSRGVGGRGTAIFTGIDSFFPRSYPIFSINFPDKQVFF